MWFLKAKCGIQIMNVGFANEKYWVVMFAPGPSQVYLVHHGIGPFSGRKILDIFAILVRTLF